MIAAGDFGYVIFFLFYFFMLRCKAFPTSTIDAMHQINHGQPRTLHSAAAWLFVWQFQMLENASLTHSRKSLTRTINKIILAERVPKFDGSFS